MEAPVDCLDRTHIVELEGIIFGRFESVEGHIGLFAETDRVRAVILDDLQEFIGLVVEHEEFVELRIIVILFDDSFDGPEPIFFVAVKFAREVFLHMSFKLGKSTLISQVPCEVVFDAILELNLVMKIVVPPNSSDFL